MKKTIKGSDYKAMLFNAAAAVANHKQALNDLNVFPVPDGDTGSNMSMTLDHAVRDLTSFDPVKLGKTAEKTAMSLTRGSHGNSGVITSLLFGGVSKALKELNEATAAQFAAGLRGGVEMAYSVVNKPAEGTILTVARKAAEAAVEYAGEDCAAMMAEAVAAARIALAETPKQNPVLAKAGVVDAGGKGWTLILEGMLAAVRGETVARTENDATKTPETRATADFSDFKAEDIRFGYCTELIVLRDGAKTDPAALRTFLGSIGDSLVLVADDEIIKIHVHTNHPGQVLEKCLDYGALSAIKIENMREQHTEKLALGVDETAAPAEDTVATPEKKYGFVAVAAGSGMRQAFLDLGVDNIVEGGQTMNPSTEDILRLINSTPSEIVFILPNNKNIILAAQQTLDLTEKQVIVLPTRSIPEGINALLAFDPEDTAENNTERMTLSAANVRTGDITYAARDSVFDDVAIRQGDYLALSRGKLCRTADSLAEVTAQLADSLSVGEADFVTVFCGADASQADRDQVTEILTAKAGKNTEFNIIDGGQPVYYFIIGVE